MTSHSHLTTNLRRQPKQRRSLDRVEKILDAAAMVFDEVGYDAATTHMIAEKAGTAVGSLYQFFSDKAAIFHAMELRHIARVKVFWLQNSSPTLMNLSLREMIHVLVSSVAKLFEQPVSRVVFIQFYTNRDIFRSIDESMAQESIAFMSKLLQQRNPKIDEAQSNLLAEVCVRSSNALTLTALRTPDPDHRHCLMQQIENLLVSYLEPYVGSNQSNNVMDVMICPHCHSSHLTKNGHRRGKQCYRCKDCGKQFVDASLG